MHQDARAKIHHEIKRMKKIPGYPPSKQDIPGVADLKKAIQELLQNTTESLTKNKIAKILEIRGDDRALLKDLIAELQEEGVIQRGKKRRLVGHPNHLVADQTIVVEITVVDEDGELYGLPVDRPADENADDLSSGVSPLQLIRLVDLKASHKTGRSALGVGSQVLLRLKASHESEYGAWEGVVLKRFEQSKNIHVGVFTPTRHGGLLSPCHRKDRFGGIKLSPAECEGLSDGDVVEYVAPAMRALQQRVKILRHIGKIQDPRTYSKLAAVNHGLREEFPVEAIKLAESGTIPPLGKRTDFRDVDLVTIDGEDARDFDDAVWAAPDTDERNPGGWRILVAIADVSYYVRPNDPLDQEAYKRGNSVYFPDRVIPMLPEALSNELCSLKPNVDRACMAIEMVLTAHGKVKTHRVKRGLMRSRARLTYTQVQKAIDGVVDDITAPLLTSVIQPLYGAYKSLLQARAQRGTLDIEMPERQIMLDAQGHVTGITPRPRFDSHKLIEEFMIAANVAAAKTLTAKNFPCLYRVHDAPDPTRIANLRQLLKQMKMTFPKTLQPTPHQFNDLLHDVAHKPFERMINDLVLRSQSQACYSPINIGHYGLSLSQYAHFTSPIRRYADLEVHRALIRVLELGEGGMRDDPTHLHQVGVHISAMERIAATAEREVVDRFVISFMASAIHDEFQVTIVGVNNFGLFVEVDQMGAQGFIPKGSLNGDYFIFDQDNHRLVGRRTRISYQLGQPLKARLIQADPLTSSMNFEIISGDGGNRPRHKKINKSDRSGRDKESAKTPAQIQATKSRKKTGKRRQR